MAREIPEQWKCTNNAVTLSSTSLSTTTSAGTIRTLWSTHLPQADQRVAPEPTTKDLEANSQRIVQSERTTLPTESSTPGTPDFWLVVSVTNSWITYIDSPYPARTWTVIAWYLLVRYYAIQETIQVIKDLFKFKIFFIGILGLNSICNWTARISFQLNERKF